MRKPIIPMLLALVLGGCDPQDLSPATLQSICAAVVGPIRYNTYNPKSGRFSGPVLALDLKQRNQIGQRLGCPLYKNAPRTRSRVTQQAGDFFRKF